MNRPFADTAPLLHAAGYSTVPSLPGTKRPAPTNWQACCNSPLGAEALMRFARSPVPYGLGVALGLNGLIACDIDTEDAAVVAAIRGVLPPSIVAKRGRRGRTDFYCDTTRTIRGRKFKGAAGMMVEILGPGNQTILPPTLHPETGRPYHWITERTLIDTPICDLPVVAPDIADRLSAALRPWLDKPPLPARECPTLQPCQLSYDERDRQRRYVATVLSRELRSLCSMLPNTGRNDFAFRLVCRVGRWVHQGILSQDQFIADVLDACERNGLVRDDGRRAVLATIASGLRHSAADGLPELKGHSHG